ncbi:MAG: lytic transglycosylase domain-containing protein [Gemmatimonadaceae bacterium]
MSVSRFRRRDGVHQRDCIEGTLVPIETVAAVRAASHPIGLYNGLHEGSRACPESSRCLPAIAFAVVIAAGFAGCVTPALAGAQSGIAWAASFNGGESTDASSSSSTAVSTTPASLLRSALPVPASTRVTSMSDARVAPTAKLTRAFGSGAPSRSARLPDVAEAQVAHWATAYSTVYRESFVRAISRGQPYGQMIATKLRNAGLPGSLIYLPVVESRFSAIATSRAGAVGLWQFMPATARGYGLRVDVWVDERRDPYRATDAAVRYLRDLYANFGDWYLVLAAYNGGDGRVTRAVRSVGSKGSAHAFWAAQSELPRETREYVPQLLGVARVGANPSLYGVEIPAEPAQRELVRVMLPPASRLTALAAVWGISLDELARLNPALNWAATPPDRSSAVVVPSNGAEAKRDEFLALAPSARLLSSKEVSAIRQGWNQ